MMFHILIVEFYFPNKTWLVIKNIINLFEKYFLMVFHIFLYLFWFPFPNGLSLDFGVRSFEHYPFKLSLIIFIHTHLIHFSTGGATCFLYFFYHSTHDMFNVTT